MLLRDYAVDTTSECTRIRADVVWEDCDRPPFVLRSVPAEHADLAGINPDAFLAAALYPARRAGERRVRVEGEICPLLVRGLETAMHGISTVRGGVPGDCNRGTMRARLARAVAARC
jgi:hypothetical protein